MRLDFTEALKKGTPVMRQEFDCEKGNYVLVFMRHNNQVFMFKFKDGKLVECNNLSTKKGRKGWVENVC